MQRRCAICEGMINCRLFAVVCCTNYRRVISLPEGCLRVTLSSLHNEASIWQLTDDNFHRETYVICGVFLFKILTADLITMAGFYSLENKEVIRIKVKVSVCAYTCRWYIFFSEHILQRVKTEVLCPNVMIQIQNECGHLLCLNNFNNSQPRNNLINWKRRHVD